MPKEATSSSEVASHTTTLRSLTNTPRSRTTDVEVDDDNDDAMSTLNRNLRDWVDDTSSYKRKRQRDETVDTVDIARSEYIQAKAKALAESTQLKNDETREALMKTREVLLLQHIEQFHNAKPFMQPPLKIVVKRRAKDLGWTDAQIDECLEAT